MIAQVLWIVLALVLLALCAVLLVFEIFIPSLGMLTVAALMSLAGGLYIFFSDGRYSRMDGRLDIRVFNPGGLGFDVPVAAKNISRKNTGTEKKSAGDGRHSRP